MAAEPGRVRSGPLASPLVLRRPHGDMWSRRRPAGREPGPPRLRCPGGSRGVLERAGACGVTAHPGSSRRPPVPRCRRPALPSLPQLCPPHGSPGAPPARSSLARTETVSGERRLARGVGRRRARLPFPRLLVLRRLRHPFPCSCRDPRGFRGGGLGVESFYFTTQQRLLL